MNYNPVDWFEIPVADIARATAFYEKLLGITLKRKDVPGYEMVWFPNDVTAKGISGALMKGMGYVPGPGGTFIYFKTTDIDAAIERGVKAGGKICLPKKDIGEYGWIALLSDSEGNTVGLYRGK